MKLYPSVSLFNDRGNVCMFKYWRVVIIDVATAVQLTARCC